MRKATYVEDPKAVVQGQTGQADLSEDDGVPCMEKKHGIPKKEDKAERQQTPADAKETARDNVLKAETSAAKEDSPVDCNW